MLIYPAIDLIGGRCVRLLQGAFDKATFYDVAPADALAAYDAAGAAWAHLVDLDGAKEGAPRQHDLLHDLARRSSLRLQLAGGVRRREDVAGLLHAGAARVVVGSRAVEDPQGVSAWIEEFGADRLTVAFDVRLTEKGPYVAFKGWRETSSLSLFEALDRFPPGAVRHVMITNIARDGALNGPDVKLYETVLRARPDIALQASGGVRDLDDIHTLDKAGAAGAIVGRALFEKRIDLEEAIRAGA